MTAGELDFHSSAPKWPPIRALPLEQVRFAYDRPSNTLFVDFYGEARPAASIPLDLGDRDYLYLRVDVQSKEVVGLQIESFLTYALRLHPELVDVLGIATLEGIEPDELSELIGDIGLAFESDRDPRSVLELLARFAA